MLSRSGPQATVGLLLASALSACSAPEEEFPAGSGSAPGGDILWVGIAEQDGSLAPIARYADDAWDSPPWAGIFVLEEIVAIRTGDGEWSWPDANQIWQNAGRDLDTLGRAPDVIATGVPASWFLYSQTEHGLPLATESLTVALSHCVDRWTIRTDRDTLLGIGTPGIGWTKLAGVGFNRAPSAVFSEDDIPDLARIREDLGLVDRPNAGEGSVTYGWLGLFRFDGMTLGVLYAAGYEGASYMLIEIDGNRGRVAVKTNEGGC